jgi:hypothetical protein
VGEEEDDPAARPGRAAFGGRSQKWFGDNRRGQSVQKLYPARPAAARSTKNLLRKETMSQSEQVIGFVVKEEGVGDAGDRGGGGAECRRTTQWIIASGGVGVHRSSLGCGEGGLEDSHR